MELTKEQKAIIQRDNRYKNFTLCDPVRNFCDMPEFDKDIKCVQLHSTQLCGRDIVGFCGSFAYKGRKVIPLDGDSYTREMPVYGYSWFTKNGKICLDILIGNVW